MSAAPTSAQNGQAAPASTEQPTQSGASAGSSQDASKISPSDVGWQFVPQYYNFVNKQPHRLHCFYNKRSTFIHGEEGDDATPALGQQEIHDRITKIGYDQCKVFINSIDSQSSAGGGIIIQVLGEMSNANKPWRKFVQTFFLAEQPNGYYVLNDIFRYLKEETDEDEEDDEVPEVSEAPIVSSASATQAEVEHAQNAPTAPVAATADVPTPEPKAAVEEQKPSTPAPEEKEKPKEVEPEVAPVEEKEKAEEPEKEQPAPSPKAEETPAPAPKAATPAPPTSEKAATPNGTSGATTPAQQPAQAAQPTAPAQPVAPAKPKSWAALAGGGKSWASSVAAAQPSTPAAAPAATPAAAPVVKKDAAAPAAATPAAPAAAAPAGGRHQFYENALKVNTPHCFVKLPNWSATDSSTGGETIDEPTLRNIASRFGDVVKVEIVKGKACAFVEYKNVESARKAIIASLTTHQGGEGGVPHGEGKLNFETRKEKDERGPKGGRRGGAAGEQQPRTGGQRTATGGGERGQGNRSNRGGRGGRQGPGSNAGPK